MSSSTFPAEFALRIQVEKERRRREARHAEDTSAIETDWQSWLTTLFPSYVACGFAARHVEFWEWVWSIKAEARPHPLIAIWPRGGAKSTSAELATVAIGARRIRPYVWYICETQDQADKHVETIAALLESPQLERYYPDMASRAVGKFGNVKGWRRNRLRTASGFTIDALGLDSAARGMRVEEHRPGLMIVDDIDGELDSLATAQKKIEILTKKLLPAGARNLAVLAVQNLVHPNSVFSQLVDGRADFVSDRIISGPHPAVTELTYEQRDGRYVITGGSATWDGQDLQRCQEMIDDFGLTAFLTECQQEVDAPAGGMFNHLVYRHCDWSDVPDLIDIQVWCDPAVTNKDSSDSHGIQADGLAEDGTIYRLYSWEARTSPQDVLRRALLKAVELKASYVGVETDQGGDTWQSVYREAWAALVADPDVPEITRFILQPQFREAKAGSDGPKVHRASQMLAEYERGGFVHVRGTHTVLERALRRFPKTKPYDLTDAAYWSWQGLITPIYDGIITDEYHVSISPY